MSPARRCRETIAPVAEMLGIATAAVAIEPGLLEIDYGAWDGLTPTSASPAILRCDAAWLADPFVTRCPGGECGADVAARAFPVIDALTAWLEAIARDARWWSPTTTSTGSLLTRIWAGRWPTIGDA